MAHCLYIEHSHPIRPSKLLNAYLTVGILLDAIKTSFYVSKGRNAIGLLLTAMAVSKAIIMLRQVIPAVMRLHASHGIKKATICFFQALFPRIREDLFYGYHDVHDMEDLKPLDAEFSTLHLYNTFAVVWAKSKYLYPLQIINDFIYSNIRP